MFNLFLDTTQDYCHIAIFNKSGIISKVSIKTNNNLTDLVVEHIDQLIKKTNIRHKDINAIYILNGPGSFTGVKVNTIIAKTWFVINKVKIYAMDSLTFQIPSNSGISILDARGNKSYVYVIQNNKTIIKPMMVDNLDLEKIIKKYKHLTIYKFFNSIDVFNNLMLHLNSFKLVKNVNKLDPLYIKPAI